MVFKIMEEDAPISQAILKMANDKFDLTERNAELEMFFEMSVDLLCIVKDDRWIKVSKSWEDCFGWTRQDFLDIPWPQLLHPGDHEATFAVVEQLKQGKVIRGLLQPAPARQADSDRIHLDQLELRLHAGQNLRDGPRPAQSTRSTGFAVGCGQPGESNIFQRGVAAIHRARSKTSWAGAGWKTSTRTTGRNTAVSSCTASTTESRLRAITG
jgi:PAS domain-containing protein